MALPATHDIRARGHYVRVHAGVDPPRVRRRQGRWQRAVRCARLPCRSRLLLASPRGGTVPRTQCIEPRCRDTKPRTRGTVSRPQGMVPQSRGTRGGMVPHTRGTIPHTRIRCRALKVRYRALVATSAKPPCPAHLITLIVEFCFPPALHTPCRVWLQSVGPCRPCVHACAYAHIVDCCTRRACMHMHRCTRHPCAPCIYMRLCTHCRLCCTH